MKQLNAFVKKEFMEIYRTGKLMILGIIFLLFGIMNPAMAKLTPWLMETLSDSLAEAGMSVTAVTVNAMSSWTQFYKNMSMELIIFVILVAGILTNEFQKGTLINMLTKGLGRGKVYTAKGLALFALWTGCYWLCFFVTYFYNMYFWDNSIASHIFLGALLIYLFGLFLISLILLFSAILSTGTGVMGAIAGTVGVIYFLGMLPKIGKFLPTYLMNSGALLSGSMAPSDFTAATVVTICSTIVALVAGAFCFQKKAL